MFLIAGLVISLFAVAWAIYQSMRVYTVLKDFDPAQIIQSKPLLPSIPPVDCTNCHKIVQNPKATFCPRCGQVLVNVGVIAARQYNQQRGL